MYAMSLCTYFYRLFHCMAGYVKFFSHANHEQREFDVHAYEQ